MSKKYIRGGLSGVVGRLFAPAILVAMLPGTAFAQEIMFCGSTSRSGSALYGAAGPYTEVDSCTPTASTQALLVSRNGPVAGNGADWLAYLNGGGVIITEWLNSYEVYNEIYGTAYPEGDFYGDCADNAMPQVKVNPSHPFWQANPINVTPSGQASCGSDMSALTSGEAAVTVLGESLDGADMFAVRPQGDGVLFLLEADWQDNEASFTADSELFMAALIEGGAFASPAPPATPVAVPTMATWALALLSGLLALVGLRRVRREH